MNSEHNMNSEPENIFQNMKNLKSAIGEMTKELDFLRQRVVYLEEQMYLQTDLNEKLVMKLLEKNEKQTL
jgi:regulator of replication initiation timing